MDGKNSYIIVRRNLFLFLKPLQLADYALSITENFESSLRVKARVESDYSRYYLSPFDHTF